MKTPSIFLLPFLEQGLDLKPKYELCVKSHDPNMNSTIEYMYVFKIFALFYGTCQEIMDRFN